MSIRTYIKCLSIILLSAITQSCTDDRDVMCNDSAIVNLTLELSRKVGTTTRTDTGIDDLNENVVDNIDVFLYKKDGALAGEQAVYAAYDVPTTNYDTDTHKATISLALPLSQYSELFPTEDVTSCDAYVVVNRPAAAEQGSDNVYPTDDLSMQSIKGNTVVYAPGFQERVQNSETGKWRTTVQDKFVMDGYAKISRNNLELSGTIPVERSAIKISLIIDGIKDRVKDSEGKFWNANKENVMVTLNSGINRTHIGTMPQDYLYTPNKEDDLFDLPAIALSKQVGDNLTSEYPFYTYPTNWGTDEACRTYFILIVNWTRDDDTNESKTTFYEIPVNPAGTYLKRNSHYKILQKIEVLGSEEEENPVVLYPCNYTILGWGNAMADGKGDTDVEAEISKLKFLVLDETNVELNNTQSRQLYFFSSNPVEILNVKVEKNNVSGNVSNIQELANVAEPQLVDNKYTITSNSLKKPVTLKVVTANANNADSRNYIYFEHQLDNNMNSESDYSEYIVTFDVQHTGDSRYIETVRITQYPMISIKADLNYDYGTDGNIKNDKNGYVFVNKNNTSSSSNSSWYAVYQNELADDGANANPNRYIISVSSITEELGDTYIIGDPRSNRKANFGNNSGITTDSNGKALQYYYPTVRESYTNTMISPEFMTASSYGRCPNSITSLDDAEKRCATYQEDGYPAGRWRLPTIAEIKYIVQLSGWGIIPSLFSTSNNQTTISYWSAHGTIKVMASDGSVVPGNDNSGTRVVRCVYDTWYWGTEHDAGSTTFVYGDKER